MTRSRSLAARQARVGIVANPAEVRLPVRAPRDVWTRWPDLRSQRRRHNAGLREGCAQPGGVQGAQNLQALAQAFRAQGTKRSGLAGYLVRHQNSARRALTKPLMWLRDIARRVGVRLD